MANSQWVPQEDGTHLPSPELLEAVRANPEKFPNAVEDFSKLSGKSPEEVQAIISNRSYNEALSPYGVGVVGSAIDAVNDVRQGVRTGLETASNKIGDYIGITDENPDVKAARDAQAQRTNEIDPKFETEKGTAERVTEGLGQAVPAIVAGVGAPGVIAGGVAAGVAGHLTFEDEDNLVQLADEVTGGAMPGFLVIDKDDDDTTRALKSLGANLASEFVLVGAGHMVAKLYRMFRPGGTPVTREGLEELAAEAGTEVKDVAPEAAETVVKKAQKDVTELAQATSAPGRKASAEVEREIAQDAAEENAASLAGRESGSYTPHVAAPAVRNKFRQEVMGALDATLKRSSEVNVGKRQEIAAFRAAEDGRVAYVRQADSVANAIAGEQYDEALDLISSFRTGNDAAFDATWKNSILKASLDRMESRLDDILRAIRKDPTLKTREAFKEMTSDLFDAKLKMAEMYREAGSSASYALLNRKLGITSADTGLLKAIDGVSDELDAALKDQGYNIFATRSDFIMAKAKKLDDLGIDSVKVLDELNTMFDEFDAVRQGQLASMKSNSIAQLSKAEKAKLENSWMRMVHDLHSSALLGQPSTSGLEVSSNTINNMLLPVANVTGANSVKGAALGVQRAAREYAGYKHGFAKSWDIFKKAYASGKSVTDDFDVLDGAHASKIDYTKMADDKAFVRYALVRLWKFAADVSIAASESQKAWRAYGVSFADGMELARKSGLTRPQAKKQALKYAAAAFDDNGRIVDLGLKLDVQRSSWQSVIDTRYLTGKGGQIIENLRNSQNPLVSTMSRATIPFFRTLVNIGGDAAQTVMPPSFLIRGLAKTKLGNHAVMSARFIDDFTGNNGVAAQVRAQARQRMGMTMFGATMAMLAAGEITITPPGGFQSWNAKMAQWETAPGSSLIVGDTSIDLTRFLPFSAPLLFAGVYHDAMRSAELEMKDGEYVGPVDTQNILSIYGPALLTFSTSLMSDAGSMRGVGEVFEAFNKAVSEGDVRHLYKLNENYLKQFMPGLPRVIGKNTGLVDGDWSQYRGEGFLQEVLASAGYKYGYKRLDFLGNEVKDPYRGLDPFNAKKVQVRTDVLYNEYAKLNMDTELSMILPTPDRVFDAAFWKRIGKTSSTIDWLQREEAPSLNKLKTTDGRNAYEAYRDIVYNGKAARDITKSTGSVGDRINIGSVKIQKGDKMEDVLRRYVSSPVYQDLTPDAREKIWKTIFGVYKKNAKNHIAEKVNVTPDLFEDSKYGSPIQGPTSITDTVKAGKELGAKVQTTQGYPQDLDDIFAID